MDESHTHGDEQPAGGVVQGNCKLSFLEKYGVEEGEREDFFEARVKRQGKAGTGLPVCQQLCQAEKEKFEDTKRRSREGVEEDQK